MNKVVYGLILGGILGIFDGLTSWFTPAVRPQLLTIVIGSTIKGIIAGVLIGFFARKVNSLPLGILFGLGVGLFLAFIVAYMQHGYYFEIMLPGGLVGLIVGYATQKYWIFRALSILTSKEIQPLGGDSPGVSPQTRRHLSPHGTWLDFSVSYQRCYFSKGAVSHRPSPRFGLLPPNASCHSGLILSG